jgi:hypothetical protein
MKFSIKRLTFIALLTLKVFVSHGQKDLREGYVVTLTSDTVNGFIEYRDGVASFKSCAFYNSPDENPIIYHPHQILAYGYRNGSVTVTRTINSQTPEEKIVFMRLLVKGKVSLLQHTSNLWLEKEGQKFTALKKVKKVQYINNKRVLTQFNEYVGSLNMFLLDCPQLQNEIQNVKLSAKDIAPLIEKYNNCQQAEVLVMKDTPPGRRISFGLEGGLNISSVGFNGRKSNAYLNGSTYKLHSSYGGVFVTFRLPTGFTDRLNLIAGVYYTATQYEYYHQDLGNVAKVRDQVFINLNQLKVPLGVRLRFPMKKYTPFLEAAVALTSNLNTSTSRFKTVESGGSVYAYTPDTFTINKGQTGFSGGLGLLAPVHAKFYALVKVQYEHTFGIVNEGALKSHVSNIRITAGIQLR